MSLICCCWKPQRLGEVHNVAQQRGDSAPQHWELPLHSSGCYCMQFPNQTKWEPKRKVVVSGVTEQISAGDGKRLTPQ